MTAENKNIELIDTHAHFTFDELLADVDGVIARSIEAGVTGWVTVGTDREKSKIILINSLLDFGFILIL